jgi:Zn-dependent peptidase ImmA (M78 family)/transcriptional regulator with XRE-family HTH domain
VSARAEVPITREVLDWAIKESGLSVSELAEEVHIDETNIKAWLSGSALPAVSELRAVAAKLHRQLAVFLLPSPPEGDIPPIAFRHPLRRRRALNFEERRYVRRAARLQSAHRLLVRELNQPPPALLKLDLSADPTTAAGEIRAKLNISLEQQLSWKSATDAFNHWRGAVELLGVIVVKYSIGEDSCRGFSLADAHAPLVAINTAWRTEARIFTLFHELGHLVTVSSSACAQPDGKKAATERFERWCEAFGAAIVVPEGGLNDVKKVDSISQLRRLADRFRVSLRAMAIRLIEIDKASWSLYRAIPPVADRKRKAGGAAGRSVRERREDELGWRGIDVFIEAVKREVITTSQALDYLDVPSDTFEELAKDSYLR